MKIYEFGQSRDLTVDSFKDGLCLYLITNEESESGNFDRLDVFMPNLVKIGKPACQRVIFGFGGYDDDSREIFTIDKACYYMQEILSRYPYFGYFVNPDGNGLFLCLFPLQNTLSNTITYDMALEKFSCLTAGIKNYGISIKDTNGVNEAIARWREVCKL